MVAQAFGIAELMNPRWDSPGHALYDVILKSATDTVRILVRSDTEKKLLATGATHIQGVISRYGTGISQPGTLQPYDLVMTADSMQAIGRVRGLRYPPMAISFTGNLHKVLEDDPGEFTAVIQIEAFNVALPWMVG